MQSIHVVEGSEHTPPWGASTEDLLLTMNAQSEQRVKEATAQMTSKLATIEESLEELLKRSDRSQSIFH